MNNWTGGNYDPPVADTKGFPPLTIMVRENFDRSAALDYFRDGVTSPGGSEVAGHSPIGLEILATRGMAQGARQASASHRSPGFGVVT